MIAAAAQRFFDLNQVFEQNRGTGFVFKFNNRIEKFFCRLLAIDRLSFINCRRRNRRLHIWEADDPLSRGAKMGEPIAKIRSKRNGSSHNCSPDSSPRPGSAPATVS